MFSRPRDPRIWLGQPVASRIQVALLNLADFGPNILNAHYLLDLLILWISCADLSEDPGLTTYFFLVVMGWGDGDSQVSRRRRRTPRIIKFDIFIKSRKSISFNFRTEFFDEK